MEVMNPVNFKQLQQKINGLSMEYFSYSTSIKDCDFSVYKPANGLLHIGLEKTTKHAPSSKNMSRSLIVWGCGEFGQHGLDQNGDVTFEMAIRKFKSGEIMLPDGEFPVTTVCGSSHTLLLTGGDQIYSWGNGTSGQLGNGTSLTTIKPTLVPLTLDNKIQGMSCGARHSFIWTNNGYCYSFGNNFNAQLGYNFSKADFKENQVWPVLVELFPDMTVKEVACGARHSLFLLTTGRVMAVGCNQHGQIGNDTTEDVVIPTMLDDLNSITHIACGNIHSLASHENGSVFAWGYGKAFGMNKTRHVATPQKFAPKDIASSVVISLAGGDCHSMVLYDCGVVFTWGNNYEGQLGVGKEVKYQNEPEAIPDHLLPRPVVQIACGETTSAAVTGKGELFMWGKNAGLIHSDKSSQYFQYIPHHVEMDGLSVMQISCGAWHVSAIIKNSTNDTEGICKNVDSESFEVEQPVLTNQELNLVENVAGLPYENRNNMIVSEDSTEQQRNSKYTIETVDTNMSDNSLNNCFITKYSSQIEVPQVNSYDNDAQLSENSLDTCFISKYSSKVEHECGVEILVTEEQLTQYSEEVISDQEQDDCLATKTDNSGLCKTEFYGVDKTDCRTNEARNTNVMDSSFGYNFKEKYEESSFSRQHENRLQLDEAHTTEKQSDSSSTTNIGRYLEGELTTTYSQEPSLRYISEYEEGRHKDNTIRNEKATTVESGNVCSIKFATEDKISLEKVKRKNNDSLPNKCEEFRNDSVVKDNYFPGNNSNEDKRNKNYSLTNCNENSSWEKNAPNNDYFLCNNSAVNVDIIKNNKGGQIQRRNHHSKHWNELKSIQAVRKSGPITEKNISEDISGLLLGSLEQNSIKESSVLKRNIRLAITPLQNSTVKHNSAFKRNTDIKLALTPARNKTMGETTGFKLALASAQYKTMDYDNQVFTEHQTMPVIDLSFGKAVGHAEQCRIKPSFTTFRNVWKASNLFREKQRQRRIGSRRGSDGVFSLESMLPNRPVHAVREIEKWSKLKEDFTHNDSTQELKTKTDKLSKCCHATGELLPPICSCKKNEVVLRKRDTLTNVFIDRR